MAGKRGLGSSKMSPEKRREIASKGGKAAHAQGMGPQKGRLMDTTLVATQKPRPSIDGPSHEAKREEYEGIKTLIATWRWSHDAAWLRHVTRYVELRKELKRGNEVLVLGAILGDYRRKNYEYVFSEYGNRLIQSVVTEDRKCETLRTRFVALLKGLFPHQLCRDL